MRCHLWTQNGPFVPNDKIFCKNHQYNFHAFLGPFYYVKLKKILIENPEWWWFILGIKYPNGPIQKLFEENNSYNWPKRWFFGKFYLRTFPLLILPKYDGKSEEKILKVDPEIYACVILSHNLTKLPICLKREFFGKFYFSDFSVLFVPYHAAKFEKKT